MNPIFIDYPDPQRFASQIEAFEKQEQTQPSPRGGIVFTGASSIRHWHDCLSADFEPLTVVGRGFGGATLNDVCYYLDRLLGDLDPRALVLYAGGHDVRHGATVEQVLELFQRFHQQLLTKCGSIRLYYISIKPVPARMQFWETCCEVNAGIKAYAESQPSIHFLNVAPVMVDADNQPRMAYYGPDNIHLNPEGYTAWLQIIRPVLMEQELSFESRPEASTEPTNQVPRPS